LPYARDDDARVGEQELADGRIESKPRNALTGGVHQHGARAVDHIARRDLLAARLEHIGFGSPALCGHPAIDAEDGADGTVDIDVRRAIEGIVQHRVLPSRILIRDRDDLFVLLRRHHADSPGVIERVGHGLIGEDVELLLFLVLDIGGPSTAQDVHEARPAGLPRR
jgi:hypothetical protein